MGVSIQKLVRWLWLSVFRFWFATSYEEELEMSNHESVVEPPHPLDIFITKDMAWVKPEVKVAFWSLFNSIRAGKLVNKDHLCGISKLETAARSG